MTTILPSKAEESSTSTSESLPEEFVLQQGVNRFYVLDLAANQTWILNCTAKYQGIFHLYLYNERPTGVDFLETTNYEAPLVQYNETHSNLFSAFLNDTVSFISLNYTAPITDLYYLEIRLVENGPDSFVLDSYSEQNPVPLQAYYLPFIPGYPLEIVGIAALGTITIIMRINKKKQKE